MNRKYAYIWEYIVNPDHMDDFLNAYTPDGEWVKLFRGNPGYIKTELLCDRDNPLRFVTIDYWESADSWQAFLKDNSSEYEALDKKYENFTSAEKQIGLFEPVE